MGFKIAIDDFGVGFSSLSYLSRLSVDILKIDRIFVSKMSFEKDLAIIRSIIGLAQNFNLSVIAEGIEKKEEADMLLSLNCTKAQGYLYSKPIAVEQFNEQYLPE
jgi:EAL domain-containing protein (putative c-di-GMP-specific phosphodiesterase class I)